MKIKDIFEKYGLEYFGAMSASGLKIGNERLHREVPEGANAIFALFPYYVENRNKYLAAFASVYDYHGFAKRLFSEIEELVLNKYPNISYVRGFSDHSPFDEREGAAKCTLGIIGQNGLLINEKYSSFVNIGELVCTLSEDELASEGIELFDSDIRYCESCGRCLLACNELCALENKEYCISAVTQKKGVLSEEEEEIIRLGGSAWGCDRCQLACPHTKRALENKTLCTKIPYFAENAITGGLEEIEKLTDGEYRMYAFSYRKRDIMNRNIEILRREK